MPFQAKSYSCGPLGQVRKLLNLNHGNWVNIPVPQAVTNGITLLDIETAPNNGDLVIAVGYSMGSSAITPFFGIAVSNNGGTTWTNPGGSYQTDAGITVDSGYTFQWAEVIIVGPQTYGVITPGSVIYAVGSASTASGHGTIARSIDGGANFAVVPWFVNINNPPGPPMNELDCTAVHFANANVGVVALHRGGDIMSWVIKTNDAGVTWTIMNNQNFLTTDLSPNLPGTILPTQAITGINILADESKIIGVCNNFIVETKPVVFPNPAGVLADSWQNNFNTNSGAGSPPVYEGFSVNLSIGYHLDGGRFPIPDDKFIYVSGDAQLGWTSFNEGGSWGTTPAPGYNPSNTGYSRRAAHYYTTLAALWNQDNTVHYGTFANPQGVSDATPGYIPNAIWTWYEETIDPPTCMQLVACDGTIVIAFYTGQVALNTAIFWYFNEPVFAGKCWRAFSSGTCVGAVTATLSSAPPQLSCLACSNPAPCTCPEGTTYVTLPNGTQVCREDIISFAEGYDPNGCEMIGALIGSDPIFPKDLAYNQFGAVVYQDIATRPWPVVVSPPIGCAQANFTVVDNGNTLVSITNNNINALWGDGLSLANGRHNNTAVWNRFWNPTSCNANPNQGVYGFLHCEVVAVTTTYYFATSGRVSQLKINGTIAFENATGNQFGTSTLRILPITLPPGNYVFEMNGAELGWVGICNTAPINTTGFVWEIYKGVGLTPASLMAMTTPGQLAAVTIYSTVNESDQSFDYGSLVDVPYNHRCPNTGQGPQLGFTLDNCFTNLLNPNANPSIYVCHRYNDVALQGCCYVLTDCTNPTITYITSTDLFVYAGTGQAITVAEYVGCFLVSQTQCGPIVPPPVTVIQSYVDCSTCAPKCYLLTDCDDIETAFVTNTDLSLYVGLVVNIEGSTTCWQVSLAGGCRGSIPVVLMASFDTCELCKPVCYQLINCRDAAQSLITSTNLSLFIGQFIQIEGSSVCWQVSIANTCVGSVVVIFNGDAFIDCETCSPTPPPPPIPPLRPRSVKPGYTTPGCDPTYTENIYCNFARSVYDQMLITRYGITMCCNDPIEKWSVKKQLLDLSAIYDPELCKNTFDKCCPPCAMFATITIFRPVSACPAPTGMVAILEVPPTQCPAPTGMQVSIVLNPTQPCVCYYIVPLDAQITCDFTYTDCLGNGAVTTITSPTYLCSITIPTTLCFPNAYTIQTTAANCLNGECVGP